MIVVEGANPDQVAIGRDQVPICDQCVLLGHFGEGLDQRRHHAGVVPKMFGPRDDDLRQARAFVDVRVDAVGLLPAPSGDAGIGGQRRRRDSQQRVSVVNAEFHPFMPMQGSTADMPNQPR